MKIIFAFFVTSSVFLSCKGSSVDANGQPLFSNVDVTAAKQMIADNPNLIILDVRTPGEIKDGKLPNAIEIDYRNSNFDTEIDKLDKTKSYLVYCKSGGRSMSACKKMNAAGFTDLTNMKGGYSAWK